MQVVSSAVCWCQITEKRDWQPQQKSAIVVNNGFIKTERKKLPFRRSVGFGVNAALTLTSTNHFSHVSDVLL